MIELSQGRNINTSKKLITELLRKSKDWLTRNQDNVSKWGVMSIRGNVVSVS
jgi:hypothetical protein